MADIRIDKLAGKPLLYDRSAAGHYGVTGVPFKPTINPDFAAQADACFKELIAKLDQHNGRKVKMILSGGVSRAGTGSSFHHKNRAFDFDGLIFDSGPNWVATSFPVRPQIYLGMEAVLVRVDVGVEEGQQALAEFLGARRIGEVHGGQSGRRPRQHNHWSRFLVGTEYWLRYPLRRSQAQTPSPTAAMGIRLARRRTMP